MHLKNVTNLNSLLNLPVRTKNGLTYYIQNIYPNRLGGKVGYSATVTETIEIEDHTVKYDFLLEDLMVLTHQELGKIMVESGFTYTLINNNVHKYALCPANSKWEAGITIPIVGDNYSVLYWNNLFKYTYSDDTLLRESVRITTKLYIFYTLMKLVMKYKYLNE